MDLPLAPCDVTSSRLAATPLGQYLLTERDDPSMFDSPPVLVHTICLDRAPNVIAHRWRESLVSSSSFDGQFSVATYLVPKRVGAALSRGLSIGYYANCGPEFDEPFADVAAIVAALGPMIDDVGQIWREISGLSDEELDDEDAETEAVRLLLAQARNAGVEPGRWASVVRGLLGDNDELPDPDVVAALVS